MGDTAGLLLAVRVHPAEHARPRRFLRGAGIAGQTLSPVAAHLGDASYTGKLAAWGEEHWGWAVESVKKPSRRVLTPEDGEPPPLPMGFQVLKWRWLAAPGALWADLHGWGGPGG